MPTLTADLPDTKTCVRRRITVRGAVQGVGFRPFVHRQATALGLSGHVANAPAGVTIEAEGHPERIDALVDAIRRVPPPHARIDGIAVAALAPLGETGFTVRASETFGPGGAQVLPDLATCDACLAELFDPTDRRHRYPFVNCTQCGPRYSIVEALPYDRARTTMRHFPLCPACRAEYDDPANRRFHAEPNACPECGPQLALWDTGGAALAQGDAALRDATDRLRNGGIVAVKGIGGFHLLVDARDETAVQRLRARKRRPDKPFAVMFPTLADIAATCRVDATAERLSTGPERPIVLLTRRDDTSVALAPSVAPGNTRLGALLPYAPLHHLLLHDLGFAVVATSGNASDEPIVIDEAAAVERLAGIADAFLVHDRPILRPLDDSVVQVVAGTPQLLRRARGYAPAPVAIAGNIEGILACGGHLKAAVALGTASGVALGPHLGDLDMAVSRDTHSAALADIARLSATHPHIAVHDLHPDYASTRAAEDTGLPTLGVQHHVAHIAACLGENGLTPPALGIAWDGTGYGTDGTVWGGEFLQADPTGWRRAAHLRPFRLPGGDAASREPRRAALGLLYAAFGDAALAMTDLAPIASFNESERTVLHTMLTRGVNAPIATSMGRLFDAFAALCGLCQRASYEGQAAAALEFAPGPDTSGAYAFPLQDDETPATLDWQPALEAALADLRLGVSVGTIAARLHNGLVCSIVAIAERVGEPRVALTGGCFQNVLLSEAAIAALRDAGFTPVWHHAVPPNDGGIAFGQAVWAGWTQPAGV